MSGFPPVTRIVTGHDSKGKAVVWKEDQRPPLKAGAAQPLNGGNPSSVFVSEAFITAKVPYDNTDESDLAHDFSQGESFKSLAQKEGAVFRAVDFPPMGRGTMHRTQSIDFGIVHEGEIYLELDDKVERKMVRGDVVVQRGTIHSWVNKTDQWCRVYFVLIGAQELKVGDKVLGKSGYEANN